VAVVWFKGNVTNATNLAIGRMHVPTRKEWEKNTVGVEEILTQEGEGARNVLVVQVVVGEGNVGEGG
jgi:hypothetical protein